MNDALDATALVQGDEARVGKAKGCLMESFVYVLGCSDKNAYRTYVGWTIDLDRRLAEHNAGTGARSTRGRSWALLYVERHATRRKAMTREWHLKRDRRFRKLLAHAK
jgi:putative endonuclease